MKEFEIINKYFKKLTLSNPAADGLNNDVANFSIENDRQLVVSKDVMVEDVHFKRVYGGSKVAHKLLTSNLSDLASAGASPHSYMIGFTKDDDLDEVFLSSFCSKLSELSKKHNISLIGGDTTSSNAGLFFSLTIFGTCPKNKILSRSGGCDEDLIFVSGNIGDSYVGLKILQNKIDVKNINIKDYFLEKHYYPEPRLSLGSKLIERNLSNTAIDVSDGLFADLNHICQNSNLGANIFLEKIPVSRYVKTLSLDIMKLLSGGEDYELIFTTKRGNREKILNLANELELKITEIGFLSKNNDREIKLFDQSNRLVKIKKYGYEH